MQTKAMLDRETWRKRFVESARVEIESGRLNRAAMARAFAEEVKGRTEKVTKQAVYDWFRSGKISDDWLVHVAAFMHADLHALKFNAEFRPQPPAEPDPPSKSQKPQIHDLIGQKAKRLDLSVQKALLFLIESAIAASDPRGINLEAENHRKAMERRKTPAGKP